MYGLCIVYNINNCDKEILPLVSMNKLAETSETSASSTEKIHTSTQDQIGAIAAIIKSMESVQDGVDHLASVLGDQE